MITLLIATRNAHKIVEIRGILGQQYRYLTLNDFPNAPEVMENAGTFAGNATKKAVELAKWLAASTRAAGVRSRILEPGTLANPPPHVGGYSSKTDPDQPYAAFVMADDSGLEVEALKGEPGVHSARFAALDTGAPGNSSTTANNAKLLRLLKEVSPERRTARFRCVLALTPVFPPEPDSASPVCYANEFELQTQLFEGVCDGRIILATRGNGGFGYDPLFIPNGYEQTFGELGEEIKNQLSHRARALGLLRAYLDKPSLRQPT